MHNWKFIVFLLIKMPAFYCVKCTSNSCHYVTMKNLKVPELTCIKEMKSPRS